ncbi:GntR family transcriptional regulator [Solicola gregarius]|uniref:GntR family transcriptional regulator n=1 Tax=Solicola gregarius TaxID=2908642 RepID=A0AA46TM52_9ACTN|nr:GntR family transcriptional regulator [Solicola gregarius]UYM07459.1 GntR family transcriptional regulator [Solicola gregarius]
MIEFYLDGESGVSAYRQIARQVRHALTLGMLNRGDQLPTVKEAVAQLAVNPNTVLKAYRELERDGLVEARPGVGTFVSASISTATIAAHAPLRRELQRWLRSARAAGLDDASVEALLLTTFHNEASEGVA